jgi:hypothetical protein
LIKRRVDPGANIQQQAVCCRGSGSQQFIVILNLTYKVDSRENIATSH